MRTYDLSPLFRSSIGFDRMNRMLEAAAHTQSSAANWPPYNIVRTDENHYQITLAVAGFSTEDLDIVSHENVLTVKGATQAEDEGLEYLHKGIAGRGFERRFHLADHVHVVGAHATNGLLTIALERVVPEALKPRRIEIGTASVPQMETAAK